MFLASLYFLYLQAFVLHAFCPFCLFSAAMTFLLAGILVASLRTAEIRAFLRLHSLGRKGSFRIWNPSVHYQTSLR